MSNHTEALYDAMLAFNRIERAEFMLDTGTLWLGLNGPTYLLGDIRVKALFEDTHGRHWCDAMLAVESLSGYSSNNVLMEGYRQAATDMDAAGDLWVCTDARGKWSAVMTPVTVLATTWGYPPPVRLPDGDWARTWLDIPGRSDEQELAWLSHGGRPLHSYRAEAQL